LRACTIHLGMSLPVWYSRTVRPAPRACAILLAIAGITVAAPIQRAERVTDSGAELSRSADRGDAPAIRIDAAGERQVAHQVALGLPPAPRFRQLPALVASGRLLGASGRAGRTASRSNRARAPPHSA
jgi:hypothetical protein